MSIAKTLMDSHNTLVDLKISSREITRKHMTSADGNYTGYAFIDDSFLHTNIKDDIAIVDYEEKHFSLDPRHPDLIKLINNLNREKILKDQEIVK